MNAPRRRTGARVRLAALAAGLGATLSVGAQEPPSPFQWSGELGLRLERVNRDTGPTASTPFLRGRIDGAWTPEEDWRLTLGLATRGATPAQLERRLDEGRADPRLGLHMAAARWMPSGEPRRSLTLGRMEQPWIAVSDLLWDPDVTPDGLAFRCDSAPGEWAGLARGGAFLVRAGGAAAPRLQALQAALLHRTGRQTHQLAGLSGFRVDPAEPWPRDARGPRLLEQDFTVVEAFGELGVDLYYPLVLYGQYARRTETDPAAEGWLAGATLGRARAIHSLELTYTYRRIEGGLFPGAWVGSDLGGGGAAQCGHTLTLTFQLTRDWQAAFSWLDSHPLAGRAEPADTRLRVEARIRF